MTFDDDFDSSMIDGVAYEMPTSMLYILFKKDGSAYRYEGVPEQLVRRMLIAPSKGQYFHGNIRGKYTASKLSQVEIDSLKASVTAAPRATVSGWLVDMLSADTTPGPVVFF